jgi:opacity protein-like surface antigen
MRLGTAWIAGATAALALASAGRALAADMPSYYAPPVLEDGPPAQPIAFGTGWYLRGDAAFGPENRPKLTEVTGAPTVDRGGTGLGYAFGAGAGYQFTNAIRIDVTADYLDPFRYSAVTRCGASCAIDRRTEVQRWDGLVNGYYDLGNWFGLTPYVGAGVGVAGTRTSGAIGIDGNPLAAGVLDPRTGTLVTSNVPTHNDARFAWAAMAGVSYAFAPHMLADVGYRYLDLGRTTVPLFPSAGVTRTITEQQVRVGVRYMVD